MFVCLSWLAASSSAAQSAGLLLVSDADVPSALERSVKRKLGQVADLVDEHAYLAAVRAAGLKPGSDAALAKLGPRAGAELIVHLALGESGDLHAEIRSGKTGAVRSTLDLPLQGRRFKRPSRALRDLLASVQVGLSQPPASTTSTTSTTASARSDREDELDEDVSDAPASSPREPVAAIGSSGSEPASARDQAQSLSSSDEQVMDDPELRERLSSTASDAEVGPRQGLGLQASVGVGPGSHVLSVPTLGGPTAPNTSAQLETGVAPAIELAAAAQLGLGQWILRAEGQYRTFLSIAPAPIPSDVTSVSGMTPTQTAPAPLASHSFTIGASPGYRFGGRHSVAMLLMLGWTYRSLQANVPTLPSGSLTGLVARPALYIPFGDGVFCLRLAPELIIVQNSETSAPAGAGSNTTTRASGGAGFGMEAALDVRLAKLLGAGLQYRRSRVVAAGSAAADQEWYVAVQAVLSL